MSSGTERPPPDNPGVVHPPFLYLVFILASIGLDAIRPLPLFPSPLVRWCGGALIALGLAFGIWGRTTFTRAGTNVNPALPATLLVLHGPYRFTRNPMYLGMTLLYLGLAIASNNLWMALLAVPLLVIVHVAIIFREERYLERKFGAEYRAFRSRVRRWL